MSEDDVSPAPSVALPIFIDGFGLSSYRSFGRVSQRIGPFAKVNLFIGQNNSGKSNILLFLTQHYRAARQATHSQVREWKFDQVDYHIGASSPKAILEFAMLVGGARHKQVLESLDAGRQPPLSRPFHELIERVLQATALNAGDNVAWFPYEGHPGQRLELTAKVLDAINAEKILTHDEWSILWKAITQHEGGDLRRDWIPRTLHALSPTGIAVPEIELVPAIRRVGEAGSSMGGFGGAGLIERLARLQNPAHDQQNLKAQFVQINTFVQTVVGNRSAILEIPFDRDMIMVHMDSKTLPLASLGTGIHEVIILAAAATVLRQQIICIEEPELHLHAFLQKKLLRYLQQETDNQYFITTHSAHLLDTPGAAIFHVRYANEASTVERIRTAVDTLSVCADLGYRASDLLQANSIVWVEGPSDRVYVNLWLQAAAPDLIEGVHYSTMFYGGRLLSHLSASDVEIDDFISLRRLNQNLAIVIDSDRASSDGAINPTKERVRAEFDRGPGFAWITQGREIENYIEPRVLHEAVLAVHSESVHTTAASPYARCMEVRSQAGKPRSADKVKVAHKVSETKADLGILDLQEKVTRLAQFIRAANGLDRL